VIAVELFPVAKSVSAELTVAELVNCPGVVGATTIITIAVPPEARFPNAQIATLHEPWLEVEETKATPAGKVSFTITFVACAGPLLMTVSR
jgi:hypothetical protein